MIGSPRLQHSDISDILSSESPELVQIPGEKVSLPLFAFQFSVNIKRKNPVTRS